MQFLCLKKTWLCHFTCRRKWCQYKARLDISNEILELINFIKEKHPGCKKITLSVPLIRTDNYNVNKENERFISSLKESDLSYIIHGNKTVT